MKLDISLESRSGPGAPRFVALVRATGAQPQLLLDTLQSLALQRVGCLAVVIAHGDAATFASVERICRDSAVADRVVILRAGAAPKGRGHPVNVGLEYCLAHWPEAEFVFALDAGSLAYPYFTQAMAAAFLASGADVVYAASNRQEHAAEDLAGMFSYVVRTAVLRDSGLRMTEELEYGEDWHFLILMLQAGFRFQGLTAVLSELRTVSPGSALSLEFRRLIHTGLTSLPVSGQLATTLADQETIIADLRQRLWALENSRSWGWTAPLRRLLGLFPGAPKPAGRRGV